MGISEEKCFEHSIGVGFCLIISPRNLGLVRKYFGKKFKPYIIGKIIKNSKKVKFSGKVSW